MLHLYVKTRTIKLSLLILRNNFGEELKEFTLGFKSEVCTRHFSEIPRTIFIKGNKLIGYIYE